MSDKRRGSSKLICLAVTDDILQKLRMVAANRIQRGEPGGLSGAARELIASAPIRRNSAAQPVRT